MKHLLVIIAVTAILVITSTDEARAQTFQSTMRIRAPGVLAINATNHLVEMEHDQTDGWKWFDTQLWQVVCNNRRGAVVTFETAQAFTHTENSSSKRNASLVLTRRRARGWRLINLVDTTDYASGDETAVVSARTRRARDGEFELSVGYFEEDFSTALWGTYEMTVIGTIVPR